jgi:hypothetical protein
MPGSLNIPLCRSEFLQEFTIHLGLILEPRYRWGGFASRVATYEHEGEELEQFSVCLTSVYRTRAHLVLWEDKTIWISVALIPENGEKFQVGFYPDFGSLGIEGTVEALVNTASIATCLCYGESPEPLLRQIWNFNGEVQIEGVI